MLAVSALRDSVDILRRNPVMFAAAALYAAVQLPGIALQASGETLLQLASSGYNLLLVFVVPFFVGGLVAMAFEGLDGSTSLSRLGSAGRDHYLSLLAVTLAVSLFFVIVYLLVFLVVGLVAAGLLAVLVLTGIVGPAGFEPGSLLFLAVVGVSGLVPVAILLVIGFLIQFYAQAVVIEDKGALDSLRRSVAVVRDNLLAVLGFDAVGIAIGAIVGGLPTVYLFLAGSGVGTMATSSPLVRLGYVALTLLTSVAVTPVGVSFAVAFYVRVTETV